MTSSDGCCQCCFSFIITLGLTALFLWLSLRVDEPKCYVGSFYVPALNKTLNTPNNRTIVFVVELDNGNKDKGIQYDNVSLNFEIFVDANTTRPVGNATIVGFYQGHKKEAKKWGYFDSYGVNRTLVNGKVYFRVNFTTSVKYKILLWYTKRDKLWGGGNVEIDDSGAKTYRKGIRLGASLPIVESGAPKTRGCYCALLGLFLCILFFRFIFA
ncbi:hypothetical protein L6164_022478 [Bauhinia variegata]|uniref:Uncharacterized protein n=1 Tax=Bauhinia variegata TaxID=167791 RepID=A0ACB9MH35_BAUVA|nr:hypothetical protein L6164_022478 [Bauhinia variegata]